MPEANGEISNEFFKKLNQQIVQKDNLIKLLQLQIKSLKTQLESNGADAEKSEDLQKVLEQKNVEMESLREELEEQKKLFANLESEKDAQIRSMQDLLEKSQNKTADEYAEDPKVAELEEKLRVLQCDYVASKEELNSLKAKDSEIADANAQLKNELEQFKNTKEEAEQKVNDLTGQLAEKEAELTAKEAELNEKANELAAMSEELRIKTDELASVPQQLEAMNAESVQKALAEANEQNTAQLSQISLEAEAYKNQVVELNRKVGELENELVGKERMQLSSEEELAKTNTALTAAKDEIARLVSENEKIDELTQRLSAFEGKEEEFNELTTKLASAESDIERLNEELEKAQAELISQTKKEEYMLQISQLQQCVVDKEEEISLLRKALEAKLKESESLIPDNSEFEALTQQVADQLVTIEAFEKQLKETRHKLNEKETELNSLKVKMSEVETARNTASSEKVTNDDSDIIADFIDFFDALDTVLSKKQEPELQALHKKLVEKLIVPNKISYMPVISEEFDPEKYTATDYFRSENFPEKCIVFEVEKGYRRDNKIIKKSKVWVVQNLFKCSSCGAEQTNSESRFCHLCGAKILAPNGLPIESLPIFEPTATTYNRFSERMIEKGRLSEAKDYIAAGLKIDPNYVPLILSMADVLISESKFQEAVDYLHHAYELKPDERTKAKINQIETKLSVLAQAKSLKLSSEEFDKLLHIIQK